MSRVDSLPAARILFSQEDRKIITERIDKILSTGRLTLGPYGEEFEAGFAKLCGTQHAISVSSGTCSLEIPLRSKGITTGNVLVPANTFFATPAAVRHAGASVRFVDQDPRTLAPTLNQYKAARNKETKAVIIVHIGGTLSDELPAVRKWCDQEGLFMLEDAAHAHGSTLNGKAAGSFGHAASFSFYPTKVMTSGEGGMIVTNDSGLATDAKRFRDQGKESFTVNKHTRLGNNWRMSEVHAAIGVQQLKRLPEFLSGRRSAAKKIGECLSGINGVEPFVDPKGVASNFYKYVAFPPKGTDRPKLKKTLRDSKKIGLTGEVYELPCHKQPVFMEDPECTGDSFPNAEAFCARHICMPIYPNMTDEEIGYLGEGLKEVFHG